MSDEERHGSGRFAVRSEAYRTIRIERVRQGLSQAALGARMGYENPTAGQRIVSRLEQGATSNMEAYMSAAHALGLALEAVIEWRAVPRK